jgi:PAS domain S-box-containing protein
MSKPLRVLIVEDSEDDLLLMVHALRKGGYEPVYERVENAEAMRNALETGLWDLILCDYQMPKFNGLAAIALLKETGIDIPLIIVSGAIGEETAAECMRLGARDFFMKGKLTRLVPSIERELREAESRRQHKRVEESLRESEENYRQLFDNSPVGIYRIDFGTGKFLKANDVICKYFGCRQEEITSRSPYDILTNDSKQLLSERLRKVGSGEKVTSDPEYEIADKKGKHRWLQLNSKNIYDAQGLAVGADVVAHDITDRKRAEDEATRVAQEWCVTFDATNDAIWILDQDQRVLRSNKTAERFFHQSYTEMIGKHCWEIVHGTGQPISECPILRVRKSLHRETMELQVGERWFEVNVDPLLDAAGRYSGAVHIVSDITERKKVEKSLRESEEKHRILLEESSDPIFSFTPEGEYLYVNRAFAKGVGKPAEEIIGKRIRDLFPKEEADQRYASLKQVVRTGEEKIIEARVPRSDGDLYYMTTITPIKDTMGEVISAICSSKEITERKQAEKQLQDTLESLRKAVGTTIQVMVSAVETRDPYTSGHQTRSADVARAIAVEMGLPQEKIDAIRMAGSIHDIGKLSIPAEILSKPTKLTEIEFSLIKEHAQKGFEMLKDVESPWPLAEIVYQHHERMDGSGYPRNLKGEEICIEARILSVADVVEAMASHRPYRPGLGIDAAMQEIEKNSGIFYDSAVADACLRLFREKGFKLEGA